MLITKHVNIILNRGNLGYYNRVLENTFKVGDSVLCPVELLPKSILIDIEVSCDICNEKSITSYRNYNDCLGYGFYSCNNCKHIKRKITNLEKYGVEDFHNLNKRFKTMDEKYGCYFNNRDKSKNTCIEKYGVDNVSKVDDVKKAKEITNNINWGVNNVFQCEIIKDRNKKIHILNLGYDHPSKSDIIKRKKIETCRKNSGFDFPMQSPLTYSKQLVSGYKCGIYNDIKYQGSYELDFLKFCDKNNILVKRGFSINYLFDRKRTYHSDFFIPKYNLICEIKSKYYYSQYLDLNEAKKSECINQGYNFIFIIDKNYSELLNLL
jgi:hypothetical protein